MHDTVAGSPPCRPEAGGTGKRVIRTIPCTDTPVLTPGFRGRIAGQQICMKVGWTSMPTHG